MGEGRRAHQVQLGPLLWTEAWRQAPMQQSERP
jgi:hypothetical protein